MREQSRPRPGGRPCPHPTPDRPRRAELLAPAQPADEPAGLGPGPHRAAGGPLAAARRRRRPPGPAAGQGGASLRRLRAPAGHPGAACRCSPPARPARFLGDVRGRVLDGLERPARTSSSPSPWSSSTSSSTSRRCWPPTSCGTAILCSAPGAALPAGTAAPHADAVLVPGRAVHPRGRRATRSRARWTTSGPRTRWTLPAFRIGRVPVTNAEWQRFVDAGGYDQPRWWSARGWAHRVEAGLERPHVLAPRRLAAPLRPASRRSRPTSRCSTSASSRPRRTPRGPGPGCPPSRSGRRPAPGTPRPAAVAAGRGGTASGRRRWPTSAARACARPRSGPTRPGRRPTGCEQLIGEVWEWTTSAFEPWPGFAPMLYAYYSAPFFGGDYRVLRGGSWAVGGDAVRPVVPQLGPALSGVRSSAGSGWPGTYV